MVFVQRTIPPRCSILICTLYTTYKRILQIGCEWKCRKPEEKKKSGERMMPPVLRRGQSVLALLSAAEMRRWKEE
jgi:hypothetical protein